MKNILVMFKMEDKQKQETAKDDVGFFLFYKTTWDCLKVIDGKNRKKILRQNQEYQTSTSLEFDNDFWWTGGWINARTLPICDHKRTLRWKTIN